MAYTLIPNPTDLISQSQAPIQTNFTEIQAAFDVNHVDFDVAGAGKHNLTQYVKQAASPVTVADEMAIYAYKNGADPLALFVKGPNLDALTLGVDFTNLTAAGTGSYTKLPSGLMIQAGIDRSPALVTNPLTTLPLPVVFPASWLSINITVLTPAAPPGNNYMVSARIDTTSTYQVWIFDLSGNYVPNALFSYTAIGY